VLDSIHDKLPEPKIAGQEKRVMVVKYYSLTPTGRKFMDFIESPNGQIFKEKFIPLYARLQNSEDSIEKELLRQETDEMIRLLPHGLLDEMNRNKVEQDTKWKKVNGLSDDEIRRITQAVTAVMVAYSG